MIKSRKLMMSGAWDTYGNRRGAYRDLVRKPEEKRPLGRPVLRWEDNIKIDFFKMWDEGA